MSNILKPNSASRRWKSRRKSLTRTPLPSVREPFVVPENSGKSKRPPAYKPAPFDVTAFQKKAHEDNAVGAHAFHADRSKRGTFGQSKGQKAHRKLMATA